MVIGPHNVYSEKPCLLCVVSCCMVVVVADFVTRRDIWYNPLTGRSILHFIVENKHANRLSQMVFLASRRGKKA